VIRATGEAPTGRAQAPAVFGAEAVAAAEADGAADGPDDPDKSPAGSGRADDDEPDDEPDDDELDDDTELAEEADLNSPLAPAGSTKAATPTSVTTPAMMPTNIR